MRISLRLCLTALGLSCLLSGVALAQRGGPGTTDPSRLIRLANPATAAPLNVQPGPTSPPAPGIPPSPSTVSAGQSAGASAGQGGQAGQSGKPADDLPLPGEREFNECRSFPGNKKVSINLKPETELLELIGWIKAISCRPFILPSNIRQSKVTIIAPQLVTANEAYRIFLSALESMGLTVQPDGQVLKIIESNRARESSIPVVAPGETVPRAEQYVTRLLRLRHITPDEVTQVLGRLKGRDGDIMPYATTNTLVITDLASNIRRMEEVVRALDVPMSGEKIWVIRLRNIVATEVTQMLQQVFGVGKQASPGQRRPPINVTTAGGDGSPQITNEGADSISQVYADDRTNSIILVASERTYQRVFALIKRLEQQSSTGPTGRIHVYALENALAEDMSQVLGGLGISVSAGSGGGARGGRPTPRPQAQSQGATGQSTGIFQDEVKVTPDKATNSLVIVATNKDFLTLRDVIRRLDLPRRQVFIEATVMEVTISKKRNLGLSYHGGAPIDIGGQQTTVLAGLSGGKLNSLSPLSALALSGLVGGAIGPQFASNSIFGQGATGAAGSVLPPMFGVLIQALQTNTDSNILQVPNILTTDNEKASITVGRNLPFPSALTSGLPLGQGAGALSSFTPFQSVQRQDVQLKLEITPHISAGEQVRLEIDHEINDVESDNYNGLGPATAKRTLKTVAVVRDQQPVVLGGIMKDRVSESVTKIPILGDIPILGYLFKNKERSVEKQMLLIVLTPYIINDPSELSRVFERKQRERREFIEAYTAFADDRDVIAPVDYSRKRGALEEINRTAVEAEREMIELRAAEQSLNREFVDAGPVELPPMPRGIPSTTPTSPGMAPPPSSPGAPKLPPPPALSPGTTPSAPQPPPGQPPG